MCVYIEVILPTVERFLLLYSLRCGSYFIMLWTMLRACFCMLFYSSAILEVLIGVLTPVGPWLVKKKSDSDLPRTELYIVYYALLLLVVFDAFILVSVINLTRGLYYSKPYLLEHYLVCRFVAWLMEVAGLITLCLVHKLLIGWYLGILFFVILEFYSFIVVYSFYIDLLEQEKGVC